MAIVTAILYVAVEKTVFSPHSVRARYVKDVMDQSAIWYLSSVIYGSFFAFVYFILAVAFSVEIFYSTWTEALRYPLAIFPLTILGALVLYFGIKFLYGCLIRP